METLKTLQLTIPLWEIMLLGVVALLCLISERLKLGLLVTFVFVFYWGLSTNCINEGFQFPLINFQLFDILYLFFGLSLTLIFILFLIFMPNE
jgi:hypothetical protein